MGITGTPYRVARGAYEGIELLPVASRLGLLPSGVFSPPRGRLQVTFSLFGKPYRYTLFPHCWAMGKSYVVTYYVAYNRNQGRSEWAVGPHRVEDFEDHGRLFAWSAGLFYGAARDAHPSAVEIVAAQRLAAMGRPRAALRAHVKAAKLMWQDPVMVMGALGEAAVVGANVYAKVQPQKAAKAAAAKSAPKPRARISPPPHEPRPILNPGLPPRPVVSPVYRLAGRDIVVAETAIGRRAFYRSTGRNSGKPGTWLPVDEVVPAEGPLKGWFNKEAFTHGAGLEKGHPLWRYGHPELKRVSDELGRMNIRRGSEIPGAKREPPETNLNRILDFFGVERTRSTMFRPVDD